MKIAINCWVLRNKQLDGIGYFSVNTFQRIIAAHPEVEFVMLCDKNFNEPYFDGKNVVIKKVFPPFRHPILYFCWMEFILPFVLKIIKPDLFVSAEGFLSLSSNCKQLSIIYDLNFEHFPENLSFKNRVYYRTFFKRFAKKAIRIATISEYSKKDIVDLYKINSDKIDNVSCGINGSFEVLNDTQKNATKEKYAAGKDYFFFVGSMHPRKNVKRLVQAFENFKQNTNSKIKLVIAGSILWSKSDLTMAVENSPYQNDIHFTGRLSDAELKLALGSAFALTFVPVFEGFGLPIVEAFQSGVPVITADVTSLPEVAGNAAIYANPFEVESISSAMHAVYKMTQSERNAMIERGAIQKQLFSWDRTASLMWESIVKATQKGV
jgi:glycosyltransferase involved in cell wall biosynthesis